MHFGPRNVVDCRGRKKIGVRVSIILAAAIVALPTYALAQVQSGVQSGAPQSGVQSGAPQSGVQSGAPQSGVQSGSSQSGSQSGSSQSSAGGR
jgi:hypothetical protein